MLIRYDVEQTPELRLHSFAIKKQGAPTLRLAADTEEVAARWTTFIKEAIERNDQVNVASYARSRVTLDVYFRDMIREETSDVSCTNTKRGSTCVSEVWETFLTGMSFNTDLYRKLFHIFNAICYLIFNKPRPFLCQLIHFSSTMLYVYIWYI